MLQFILRVKPILSRHFTLDLCGYFVQVIQLLNITLLVGNTTLIISNICPPNMKTLTLHSVLTMLNDSYSFYAH